MVNDLVGTRYADLVHDTSVRYYKGHYEILYELAPEDLVNSAVVTLLQWIDKQEDFELKEHHTDAYIYKAMIDNIRNAFVNNRKHRLRYKSDGLAYQEHDVMGHLEVEERSERSSLNRIEKAYIVMRDEGYSMTEIMERLDIKDNYQYYKFTNKLKHKASLITGDYKNGHDF